MYVRVCVHACACVFVHVCVSVFMRACENVQMEGIPFHQTRPSPLLYFLGGNLSLVFRGKLQLCLLASRVSLLLYQLLPLRCQ